MGHVGAEGVDRVRWGLGMWARGFSRDLSSGSERQEGTWRGGDGAMGGGGLGGSALPPRRRSSRRRRSPACTSTLHGARGSSLPTNRCVSCARVLFAYARAHEDGHAHEGRMQCTWMWHEHTMPAGAVVRAATRATVGRQPARVALATIVLDANAVAIARWLGRLGDGEIGGGAAVGGSAHRAAEPL